MEIFNTNLYIFLGCTIKASEPIPEQKPVLVGSVKVEYDSEYVSGEQIQDMFHMNNAVKPEDVLDAASRYLTLQYGISALSHPVDRSRILSALEDTWTL